ncbi:hypothetical protein HYW21_01100 [Candidatus Woesearchaeota archaeon]|nr:hypothetical protein [Candidatus Woesearchaeota archaeon]
MLIIILPICIMDWPFSFIIDAVSCMYAGE